MFKRILPLVPGLPSLGWFVLGWTMLAHASTGVFAFSLFGAVSKWLDGHAWAGFGFGLVVLAVAVAWPDLQKRFPDWTFPKTPHEKVHALDTRCNDVFKLQGEFNEQSKLLNSALSQRVSLLDDYRGEDLKERYALQTRVSILERKSDTAEQGLDDHRHQISDLERRVKLVEAYSHKHG